MTAEVEVTRQDKKVFAMLKAEAKQKEDDFKMLQFTTDINTVPEKAVINVPLKAQKMFGCDACEWCGHKLGLCPLKLTKNDKRRHRGGICQRRMNYLQVFTNDYEKQPTFSKWHRDFMVNRAAFRERKEYVLLEKLEADYEKLKNQRFEDYYAETGKDAKEYMRELKTLNGDLKVAKAQWQSIWDTVLKYEDKQVDRETPKRVETTERKLFTLSDINQAVRDFDKEGVIDADWEEIDANEEVEDNDKEVQEKTSSD